MKEIILNTVQKTSPDYRKYKALVDDEDYDRVNKFNWHIDKRESTPYAVAQIKGEKVYMHKLITGFKQTDHKDGDGLNNQRDNLRNVSKSQNAMNMRPNKNTSSKFKGVSWSKHANKWEAYITIYQKRIYLGLYEKEINAAQAYNFAAEKYHGEYAKLNIL